MTDVGQPDKCRELNNSNKSNGLTQLTGGHSGSEMVDGLDQKIWQDALIFDVDRGRHKIFIIRLSCQMIRRGEGKEEGGGRGKRNEGGGGGKEKEGKGGKGKLIKIVLCLWKDNLLERDFGVLHSS